ncbi:hypothetical protein BDV12DRAFT_94060 [Aspergillus spectabilis]
MFEGNFAEAKQVATLEEVEGVVSVRSLEALIQWLYLRRIQFDCEGPEDQISATIELVRLADMCNITGMESQMAQYIKAILVANPDPRGSDLNDISISRPIASRVNMLSGLLFASGAFSASYHCGSLG